MKSYDELKKERLIFEKNKINLLKKEKKKMYVSYWEQFHIYEQIKKGTDVIENIDEVVKMQIANHANHLVEGIRESFNLNDSLSNDIISSFYTNFSKYLHVIAGLSIDENGKFKKDESCTSEIDINVQKAILYFDFSINDLSVFKVKIITDDIRDKFIEFINFNYGTNIPLESEILIVYKKLNEAINQHNYNIAMKEWNIIKLKNGNFLDPKDKMYPLFYQKDILENEEVKLIFGDISLVNKVLKKINN